MGRPAGQPVTTASRLFPHPRIHVFLTVHPRFGTTGRDLFSTQKYQRTGKIKANRKRLRSKGYQFRDDDDDDDGAGDSNNNKKNNNEDPSIGAEKVNDVEVMSYFTLPAEYAFVARAISQMDGVGKSLDPDFDFISSAAPYIVEIKGTDLYLRDEADKFFRSCRERAEAFRSWLETILREWQDGRQ